jgi:hypothetical protein
LITGGINAMLKKLVLCVTLSVSIVLISNCAGTAAIRKFIYPIEVSGKILDKDGRPFTEQVELKISVSIDSMDYSKPPERAQSYENNTYTIPVQGGTFTWKGEGTSLSIEAIKEGYNSTLVDAFEWGAGADRAIKYNDILIYLIPKGISSSLQFTRGAEVNEEGDKPYGWSFTKRWYFPVEKEESIGMIQSFTEGGEVVYTMKEPGGFVLFPGFTQFESKSDRHEADFKLMPEAPEEGYVQSITPAFDNRDKVKTHRGIYYYFKTPDGKYGKICFEGRFDYYLQPDGSRNLEIEKIWYKPPLNPKAEHMPDDPQAYPIDE